MRLEQLTFTRFLAAIAIVIFHYGQNVSLFSNEYVAFIFEQANFGVSYFFILSGFVMIIAYYNKPVSFFQFIKNRLSRIYPLYLFVILTVLLINHFRVESYQDLMLNIIMLQTWVPLKALTVNPPGWSLSVELFFYILFPFLFNRFYKTINIKKLALGVIVFWLISQSVFYFIIENAITIPSLKPKTVLYHPLFHLNEFIIGNLAGLWFMKNHRVYKGAYLKTLIISILIFVLLLKFNGGILYHNGLLALVFTPIIVILSLSKSKLVSFLSKKQFIFLGEISFGIYILQFPVWLLLSDFRMKTYLGLIRGEDDSVLFLIRVMVLMAMSALSFKYFETPIRHYVRNINIKK